MEGRAGEQGRGAPAGLPGWHAFVRRHEGSLLAAVLAFAALVRALRWQLTAVMFNDGPAFLALAQSIAEGDWRFALRHPFHPLYPVLIAAVEPLAGDWERAAVAVAVAGGTLAVAALYFLVREMLGPLHAWIAAALLAVHPRGIEYAGDIQSEGVYLALFLGAAALLWRGLYRGQPGSAFGGGALVGAAYLTRPEGLGLLVVSLAFAAFWLLRGRWSARLTVGWSAAALAGALLLTVPYVAWLRAEEGVWMVSQKKSLAVVVGLAERPSSGPDPLTATALLGLAEDDQDPTNPDVEPAPVAEPESVSPAVPERSPRPGWGPDGIEPDEEDGVRFGFDLELADLASELGGYLRTHFRAIRYQMLLLLVVGWALRPSLRPGAPGAFVLVTVGAYMALLLGLAMNVGYVSNRHAFPAMVLTFGYAADGVLRIGGAAARRRPRRWRCVAPRGPRRWPSPWWPASAWPRPCGPTAWSPWSSGAPPSGCASRTRRCWGWPCASGARPTMPARPTW
jgi:4-amino-4-deoxy-L-arabinose transferase-like glycosyltransferase